MPVTVRLPSLLRSQTGGVTEVELEGESVAEVIGKLKERLPGIVPTIWDEEGKLYPIVSIYVNDEHIRYRQGLQTPLQDGDTVYVVPIIMGG